MKGMFVRLLLTMMSVFSYVSISRLSTNVGGLITSKVAGKQFEASDASYLMSDQVMSFFSHSYLPLIALFFVTCLIWWKPVSTFINENKEKLVSAVICIVVATAMFSTSAFAYYDVKDWNEPYFILPNESAFFVPDVGDNKSSQTKFGSEAYLLSNQIPAKRFSIPHVKLENSGFWSNYYVPSGRLIVVDRTPFAREWVASAAKGTSTQNQGFTVQSKEGLNMTVGISIAASVMEQDAAKFLFRFGVKPPTGDRTKPEVIFTSVYYGKSLTEVMDSVIRSKVQALLSKEFTTREFIKCNAESDLIMTNVEKNLIEFLKGVGITLDYIGWADTFEFDHNIQDAINRKFVANQDELIAKQLAPYQDTIKTLAMASTIRSFGDKTDGKLPTTLSMWGLPSVIGDMINGVAGKQK